MRAELKADPVRGAGYGIIEIFDAEAFNAYSPAPSFVLSRASDGKHLSVAGWQVSESPLQPDAWDSDGGSLRLAVGPAVVDEIDSLDAYRLSLPDTVGGSSENGGNSGAGAVCALEIGLLRYSHIEGGRGVGVYSPPPAPEPLPTPAPEPEPVPEPAPEPATEAPLNMKVGPTPSHKSARGMVIGLLVLLLAAAGAGWYFFVRTPEQRAAPTPLLAPVAEAPAKPAVSPLAAAREQLRGEALPDVSLALAKPLRKADAGPEECDAAFLLLEDAAQKGNGEAMLLVGQFYDPAATLPRGSIPSDAAQAKRWYDAAAQKDLKEAAGALQSLRSHVQALAAKGDQEAEALLQNWK